MLQSDEREPGSVCVSIHDVAPDTWAECELLLQAVHAVADIPITWLVIPNFRGNNRRSHALENGLERMLGHGHELALHGYTHTDEGPALTGSINSLMRTVYTEGEGEFAAIGEQDARRRIALGLAWFDERGWPVSGFVAPAWLIGPQAWQAIHAFPFLYTTTFTHFHLLASRQQVFSPSLVYAARNMGGRALSPLAASTVAYLLKDAPLVRLSLHPRDARHPALVRHAQRLIARLLDTRMPLTKAEFARTC